MSENRDHLLIVTDGVTQKNQVDESDKLMSEYKIRFKFVTTFIIHDEFDSLMRENLNDPNERSGISQQSIDECRLIPDLSVGAPYSRRCQNITYCIKLDENNNISKSEMASMKSEDINALNNIDSINNYNDFVNQFEKLNHAIQALMLGKAENTSLLEKLNSLNNRVTNSGLNSQQSKDFEEKFGKLQRIASGKLNGKFRLDEILVA